MTCSALHGTSLLQALPLAALVVLLVSPLALLTLPALLGMLLLQAPLQAPLALLLQMLPLALPKLPVPHQQLLALLALLVQGPQMLPLLLLPVPHLLQALLRMHCALLLHWLGDMQAAVCLLPQLLPCVLLWQPVQAVLQHQRQRPVVLRVS
jgi:hypothetical protein